MSVDRPLSGPQEIALAKLATATDARARRGGSAEYGPGWGWCRSWWIGRANTVDSLERLGLVELRLRNCAGTLNYDARITEAGREMLASMGD